jgi:hypothetical protein
MGQEINETVDFYLNEEANMVFTAKYFLRKGECCGNGCRHCPYNYINVPEPKRSELIISKTEK